MANYSSRSLSLPIHELTHLREAIILNTVRGFQPELFLVDHSPIGMRGELTKTLRALRCERPTTRIILGLRDVIDSERTVVEDWERNSIYSVMDKYYDRILVYGMEEVFDTRLRYRLPPCIADKTSFMGYVCRNVTVRDLKPIRSALASRIGKLVVVTLGGGGDGHLLARKYLSTITANPADVPFDSLIVTGPLMSDREVEKLKMEVARNELPVEVWRFLPNILDYFAAADAIVCMGATTPCAKCFPSRSRSLLHRAQVPDESNLFGRPVSRNWAK